MSDPSQPMDTQRPYYPYGILGYGYVLNDEQRRKLRPFVLKTLLLLLIPAAVAALVGVPFAIPAFLAVAIYHYIAERRFLASAQRTAQRQRISELLKRQGQAFSTPWLLFALAFTSVITIICTLAAFRSLSSGDLAEALHRAALAVILALCFLIYGGIARFKWRRRSRLGCPPSSRHP